MTLIYNQRQYRETRKQLRNNSTEAEKILWQELKGGRQGIKFRRQYGIGGYIADFCAPRQKLVIEIDGGIHLERYQKLYDHERQLDIENLGFKVIRLSNEKILNNLSIALTTIRRAINQK
ncbi:endonuclease domain-containing protein [Candidatus Kuenenbacteria bacterium]|nr:endonuclease domain-containing protein [Candidatus Kuenenbacteria bacterium]